MILFDAIRRGCAERRLRRRNRRRVCLSELHVEPHLVIGDMAAGQWADPFNEEINPTSGRSRSPDLPQRKKADFAGLRRRSGFALLSAQARKIPLILIVAELPS